MRLQPRFIGEIKSVIVEPQQHVTVEPEHVKVKQQPVGVKIERQPEIVEVRSVIMVIMATLFLLKC